jgi:hypothetical protein
MSAAAAQSVEPSALSRMSLIVAAATCFATFLYFIHRTAIRVPVYDMLDWLQFYDDRLRANDWLGYLWTPDNGHRILFTRALIAVDIQWLDGYGTASATFNAALWTLSILAAWQVVLTSKHSPIFNSFACCFVLLILSPTYIVTAISMPGPGQHLQTASFALLTLVLFDNEINDGPLRASCRSCALTCACLSSFGVSGGLLIWPVLIWSGWRAGLSRYWILSVIGTGFTFTTLYLWKMPAESYQSAFSVKNVIASIDYGIRFLGLPWSHAAELTWPSRVVGSIILTVGGFVISRASIQREKPLRAQRIGAALILFALLCAAAATVVRVDIPGPIPIRYAVLVVLAHLGLLLYALPYLLAIWEKGHARSLQWAAVIVALGWLGHSVVVGEMAAREADHYNDAWSRFIIGQWTPDMVHYIYPDRERARAGLAYLLSHQVNWTLTAAPVYYRPPI